MIWVALYIIAVVALLWLGHRHELAAHAVEPRDDQFNHFPNHSHVERF